MKIVADMCSRFIMSCHYKNCVVCFYEQSYEVNMHAIIKIADKVSQLRVLSLPNTNKEGCYGLACKSSFSCRNDFLSDITY